MAFLNFRIFKASTLQFIKPHKAFTTCLSDQSHLLKTQLPVISLVKYASQAAAHNHSKLWTAEKAVSGSLLMIIPASIFISHPISDYLLAIALTAHIHWGVEAIVVDYIRPKFFGTTIPKIGVASVYVLSMLTLGGLFYFNYTDVGLVKAIKMLWKL